MEKAEAKQALVMIIGDLNARVGNDHTIGQGILGRYNGDEPLNNNGDMLLNLCIQNQLLIGNTLFNHKKIHKITFEGDGRDVSSTIDYFIYSKEIRKRIRDVKVIRGAELNTDHRLLVAETRFRKPRINKKRFYERIKYEELRKDEKKNTYQENLDIRFKATPLYKEKDVELKWQLFKKILLETSEEICGKKKVGPMCKNTKWWNEQVKTIVKEKKRAWKRLLQTGTRQMLEEYKNKRNEAKRIVAEAKKKSWEEFGKK